MEEHARMHKQLVLIARSEVQSHDRKMVCCVLNPTNKAIKIRKHTPIGTLTPVEAVAEEEVTQTPAQPPNAWSFAEMRRELETLLNLTFNNTALKGDMLDKLVTLLHQSRDLFVTSVEQLPFSGANVPPFRIDTQDALPYCARRMRYRPEQRREIEGQVKQMLDAGIKKHCSIPRNSNVVLICKENSYRFCVDFRFPNYLFKIERFLLPTLDSLCDTISDQLMGSSPLDSLFSLIDLQAVFGKY
jgi:hypothetical protein